ncbi:hypothetical protein [Desulfococcus sp.]|uniref:hypothetical protein n=1 Tax=Desulfococcus sp. TaxID=2025834 RepID=UPI003593F817
MSSPVKKKRNWKKILFEELVEYWINVAYLALVFAAFTQYRRIVLAAHDITYTNYWVAVIEALIFAKVIMIGAVFRLGRGLENKPLIYPTLHKTVVFTIFVAVFTLMENAIKGLLTGKGFTGGLVDYFEQGPHEFLAGCMIILVAFIPFFAFKELGRVLGQDKMTNLFFRRREAQ